MQSLVQSLLHVYFVGNVHRKLQRFACARRSQAGQLDRHMSSYVTPVYHLRGLRPSFARIALVSSMLMASPSRRSFLLPLSSSSLRLFLSASRSRSLQKYQLCLSPMARMFATQVVGDPLQDLQKHVIAMALLATRIGGLHVHDKNTTAFMLRHSCQNGGSAQSQKYCNKQVCPPAPVFVTVAPVPISVGVPVPVSITVPVSVAVPVAVAFPVTLPLAVTVPVAIPLLVLLAFPDRLQRLSQIGAPPDQHIKDSRGPLQISQLLEQLQPVDLNEPLKYGCKSPSKQEELDVKSIRKAHTCRVIEICAISHASSSPSLGSRSSLDRPHQPLPPSRPPTPLQPAHDHIIIQIVRQPQQPWIRPCAPQPLSCVYISCPPLHIQPGQLSDI